MGGGDWWARYASGETFVVETVARYFSLASSYYAQGENQRPLTQSQLIEVVSALFGNK